MKHLSLVLSLGLVGACTSRQQQIQPDDQKKTDQTGGQGNGENGNDNSADAGKQINNQAGAGQTVNKDDKINGSATPGASGQEKINGDASQAATGTAASDQPGTTTAGGTAGKHAPYKPVPQGYSRANVDTWVAAHKAKNPTGFRYVYVPAELVSDPEKVNILRVAAGKAWNHLSWQQAIDVPEDISDGAGLAFALNAAKVWGAQADTNWGFIANCTPKANIDISPAPVGACESFPADQPVNIPRFVFNATNGGPYANVHQTPPNFDSFTRTFDMGPIKYVSTHKEAIVCGPRITAYRQINLKNPPMQLWYSFTSDEFDGRDNGNINYTNAPTDADQRSTGALNAAPGDGNTAIATEWWIQLPNGFMYWGIHGEGSQERGKAEFPFAIDPANWRQGNDLATGRSCITCHIAGIQSAKSDDAFAGKNGWTSNPELDTFYTSVREKFQAGMKTLVAGLSDGSDDLNSRLVNGTIEPVAKAIREIEGGYTGGNDCSFFCNGKYGPQRQNLCETLPTK